MQSHPFDQFNNNQDLWHYLNNQQQHNQTADFSSTKHRRNNSQGLSSTKHKQDYERLLYGMNQNLQEHMLGNTKRSRKGGFAASSVNSFGSENKDVMGTRFSLPKIPIGAAQRNMAANQFIADQALAAGLGGRFNMG